MKGHAGRVGASGQPKPTAHSKQRSAGSMLTYGFARSR
jgi:hypothetical protein